MRKTTRKKQRIGRRIKIPKGVDPGSASGTIFLPDHLAQVKAIAWRGSSDDEIAGMFGVDKDLFQKWKKHYPSFRLAIEMGRSHPTAEVERGLFERATGYDYHEDGLTRTGRVVALKRHAIPDVSAQKFWLTNRDKENWNERHSLDGGGTKGGGTAPIEVKSRSELIYSIMNAIEPQDDNEQIQKK